MVRHMLSHHFASSANELGADTIRVALLQLISKGISHTQYFGFGITLRDLWHGAYLGRALLVSGLFVQKEENKRLQQEPDKRSPIGMMTCIGVG